MSETDGTQERKRRARAAPSPGGSFWEIRWLTTLAAAIALLALLHTVTNSSIYLVLALPVGLLFVAVLAHFLLGLWLLASVRINWTRRGMACLLIHSNSPIWKSHIEAEWLRRFGDVAIKLDWSDRSRWGQSLEVKVFRHFCGARRNFNPAVIVFRGLRAPLVFRFYEAFHEAKIGRGRYLDELESRMFEALR